MACLRFQGLRAFVQPPFVALALRRGMLLTRLRPVVDREPVVLPRARPGDAVGLALQLSQVLIEVLPGYAGVPPFWDSRPAIWVSIARFDVRGFLA